MPKCQRLIDVGRRQFLRGSAIAAAGGVAAAVTTDKAKATPALARVNYPSAKLGNIKDLKVDDPVEITYPDQADRKSVV